MWILLQYCLSVSDAAQKNKLISNPKYGKSVILIYNLNSIIKKQKQKTKTKTKRQFVVFATFLCGSKV